MSEYELYYMSKKNFRLSKAPKLLSYTQFFRGSKYLRIFLKLNSLFFFKKNAVPQNFLKKGSRVSFKCLYLAKEV